MLYVAKPNAASVKRLEGLTARKRPEEKGRREMSCGRNEIRDEIRPQLRMGDTSDERARGHKGPNLIKG